MPLLDDAEIQKKLSDRPGWTRVGDRIQRSFDLDDFVEAVDFTQALVDPAEAANHHPDLEVSWGSVIVNLTTHDAGGLTEKDFNLASTIDEIYEEEFQ